MSSIVISISLNHGFAFVGMGEHRTLFFFIDKNNLLTDQSKKCPCGLTRVLFQSLLGFYRITILMQKKVYLKNRIACYELKVAQYYTNRGAYFRG
ncbi:hypothetical protein J3U68_03555 [Snodgrassella sp. B3882]|uniref:hypothetical protein n=1 Tax=Snodgrassella sp. B3882 TaxID=2818037 RepID=UPI0022698BE3|nr:hypothetical protein [Snodgrassella sp. B3882]MCX8744487.1 hypothetical protein [Snodgrassella sp. B3882]